MGRTERFYKIEMLIRAQGCISFAALLAALEVSPATLKRDLAYLRERLTALDRPAQWCAWQVEHPEDWERAKPKGWKGYRLQ